MALIQEATPVSGTGPLDIVLNSVTGGNTIIVGVMQPGSAIRTYQATSNIDGALESVIQNNPNAACCAFVLRNATAGNHTITCKVVSYSERPISVAASEHDGLDNVGTIVSGSFYDPASTDFHYSAEVGDIDTLGPSLLVCFGVGTASWGSFTATSPWTGLSTSLNSQYISQYQYTASASTDERGEWTSTGTDRRAISVIIAIPLASASGQTLEFSGSIPLPELDASLNASAELEFSGSIPLPELSAQLNSTLQLSFNGSIPLPEFTALLDAKADLSAALSIPLPSLSAVLSQVNTETLVFNGSIPLPTISAALAAHAELSGSFSIPLPTISASLLNGAPDNFQALYKLWNFRARLDVKLEIDSGNIEADELDVGGTFVAFNKAFKDINSITVSALSTTEIVAIYDFVDVPNPTGFYVYAFDTAGNRVTATVSWKARGVL